MGAGARRGGEGAPPHSLGLVFLSPEVLLLGRLAD